MTKQPIMTAQSVGTKPEEAAQSEACMEQNPVPQADTIKASGDVEDGTMYIDPAEDALNATETVHDMAAGVAGSAFLLAAAGCLFMWQEWYRWVLGVLLGACVAELMLRHLYVAIDRALDMDGEHASKYMKKSATLRLLMAAAALAIGAFLPEIFHVFGVFIGVLCLKFSAYLQPLTHKLIKFLSKGR